MPFAAGGVALRESFMRVSRLALFLLASVTATGAATAAAPLAQHRAVYDLVLDEPQLLFRRPAASHESALRPHIAGDLLVWMHVDIEADGEHGALRYAFLPGVRDP